MAITYTYSVDKLWSSPEPINGFDRVVLDVHFTVLATDTESGNSATQKMNVNLSATKEGQSFTDYFSLLEEQVIRFAKNALGPTAVSTLEEVLAEQILQENLNLPW